ncbi:MAG TPA: M3 family metallopeptidase [Terriglobales bacterium]|nr:M3 family metallopeptidase [Terriglobales bacterium]
MGITRQITVLLCVLISTNRAQSPPDKWSADLARYYFVSPEAEKSARADLDATLKRLENYKGKLNNGSSLVQAFQAYEDVLRIYNKHDGYLHLRCSQNRKDAACDDESGLESELNARSAFFKAEVLAISELRLHAFFLAEPEMKPYRFALDEMRRDIAHTLPASEEELLSRLRPEISEWQYELYDHVVSAIPFGTVTTAAGPLDVIRQRNLLASNPDARVREEAFKRRLNGFASQRELLAFALIHTVKAQESLATAQHYSNAPDRKYTSMYLKPQQARNLLQLMAQHGEVAKRFEKIRATDFERAHHAQAHAWDLSAPEPGLAPPITPLQALPALFHAAFAGLGPEYQAAFDSLLAPGNGRADVIPGGAPNRYAGGFSIGFTGATSILFYGRYDGTFKDLSVIAHEGGHAVHRSLMSQNDVKPIYAMGAHFLFESFAAFNELLLADYLAEHTPNPALQRFYRKQWMSIKGLDTFYGAQDALLEQAIYDGVSRGSVRSADDLDKLSLQIDGNFSDSSATTPELRNRWATLSLMYEDPLYNINYVYGGLLALKYYQLYISDRERFVPRYIALLKNGFDAPPDALLKKFLDVDLFDPALLSDGLRLLNARLDQLENSPDH